MTESFFLCSVSIEATSHLKVKDILASVKLTSVKFTKFQKRTTHEPKAKKKFKAHFV